MNETTETTEDEVEFLIDWTGSYSVILTYDPSTEEVNIDGGKLPTLFIKSILERAYEDQDIMVFDDEE